jgi:hypothetical protein
MVGTVTDSTDKVIAGALVTAVETSTLDTHTTTTNEQGYYTFEFVRVGTYSISIERAGFQRVTKTGIQVDINQIVRTDFKLSVGAVTQSVTVRAEAAAIKTDDATVSEVLGTRSVADLPLNGRDPMMLAVTTPGVLLGPKSSATGTPPGEDFNGAGTREIDNELTLDGISIMSNLITNTSSRPMVESIQEVEVQTGTYSAQYGSYLGVHINMVTKSGTNSIHGAVLEFFRNNVLDARNFFTLPTPTNPTAAKPPLRQNQFGGEVDGPVVIPKLYNGRDKTFFMASYEGFRNVQSSTSLSTEMPAAFFSGNFPGVTTVIKDPFNNNTPFPGNVIPTARISPVVQKLVQYFPSPNLPGLSNNLSVPVPSTASYNQTIDRIDQNISEKVRLYVRASYQSWTTFGGNQVPINGATTPYTIINDTVGYTHTFTPNLVNDFRVGRNYFTTATVNPFAVSGQKTAGTSLGIPGFTGDSDFNNPGIPDFNITGFNGLANASSNWYQNDSTTQLSEQISWNKGNHNIMGGMEFRRLATGRAAVNSARGTFTFNGQLTGYAPADFILGLPQNFATDGPEVRGRTAEWRDGFFALDKWQVSRKITINYGLRYELPTVAYTINGIATELNPQQTAFVGGTPGFHFTGPNHKDWAPRVGVAYRFTEKTVFRAGAGIYYNPNQTNSYTFLNINPPYTTQLSCVWSTGLTPPTLSNPFGSPGVCPTSPTAGTVYTDPWVQPTPRMNQWSAALERQLWNGGGFEVGYLGSHSYHLDRSYYNNTPLVPGPGAVNSRRPNTLFGVIRTIADDEIGNYHQMSVVFHQRMSHGLQILSSYTWSHALDITTDSNGGGAPLIPYNWRDDYGNANWDVRHRFLTNFVYDIPFFHVENPFVKAVFSSWQTNGIITLQTGIPINVTTSVDTANTSSGGTYRPNLVSAATDNCGLSHLVGCINPAAFTLANLYPATPGAYAYGSAGRNLIYGPGIATVNVSLLKNFPIKERLRFQFRFEMFNALNHTNFSNPAATFSTSSFGNITSTSTSARNIQLGAKLLF